MFSRNVRRSLSMSIVILTAAFIPGLALAGKPAPTADVPPSVADTAASAVVQQVGDYVSSPIETTYTNPSEYWTAERLANAEPMPLPAEPGGGGGEGSTFGTPTLDEVRMSPPSSGEELDPASVWSSDAAPFSAFADGYTGPWPFTGARSYYKLQNKYPVVAIGKLFFTQNGLDYTCSASVVYDNVVWTAGHCVYDLSSASWSYNVIFIPGYKAGSSPKGVWSGINAWAYSGWTIGGDYSYDSGTVITDTNWSGLDVGDRTGWLGFLANASRVQHWNQFGYPANILGAEYLINCQSSYAATDAVHTTAPASDGVGCDMTQGSSGGPWIVGWGSAPYVNGNVSHGHLTGGICCIPDQVWSPYFGDVAWGLFCVSTDYRPAACP